ncbi:MAG TPA: phosphatidate cytidylyltransferase, partial [Verrucomicrobiae bacterium]|nr:phosphatidate cytidylyltransferase [Verrucomicrobiae bacterium]
MNAMLHDKIFDYRNAFNHPVTAGITLGIIAILVLTPVVMMLLSALGRIGDSQREELFKRYRTWLILAPLMIGPVLLSPAWTIAAVFALSLLCYREYARATGLFREKLISVLVVTGI